MSKNPILIPPFPGYKQEYKTAPNPPKFLIQTKGIGAEAKTEYIKVDDRSTIEPPKLRSPPVDSDVKYTETKYSSQSPIKSYNLPPHQFVSSRKVNSLMEEKGNPSISHSRVVENAGALVVSKVPQYVGSSFMNTTYSSMRPRPPMPLAPAVPRPFIPPSPSSFNNMTLLNNRTADGKILGAYSKRYENSTNVPVLPQEVPLGPDNQTKELSETWTACWDSEAGAVYYYNKISGEATWIAPKLS